MWLLPSEVDGIVGTDLDNTATCESGPWAGPVLAPAIWESRGMEKIMGPLDSYDDLEPYRCPVPNWVYSNPIWLFKMTVFNSCGRVNWMFASQVGKNISLLSLLLPGSFRHSTENFVIGRPSVSKALFEIH